MGASDGVRPRKGAKLAKIVRIKLCVLAVRDTLFKIIKCSVTWQCDFACKRKWTIKGMVDLYLLVFIHKGTRRIWVSPLTANPTGEWMTQQAGPQLRHVR